MDFLYVFPRKIGRDMRLQNCSNKFGKNFSHLTILYDVREWDYVNSCYLSSRELSLERERNADYMELSRLTVLRCSKYRGEQKHRGISGSGLFVTLPNSDQFNATDLSTSCFSHFSNLFIFIFNIRRDCVYYIL